MQSNANAEIAETCNEYYEKIFPLFMRKQEIFHENEQNMNSILRIIASRKIMQL